MGKKAKKETHENHERWMVSYADLVTLLFAFFVVMFASMRTDQFKFSQALRSIQLALRFEGKGGVREISLHNLPPSEGGCPTNLGSGAALSEQAKKRVEEFRRRLERRLKPLLLDKVNASSVQVVLENNRLKVRLSAERFFDVGDVNLRVEALPILDVVASEILSQNRPIRVEAHTDNAPVSRLGVRSNWELSAFRASSVVSYLEDKHQAPTDALSAEGMGAAHPLVPNTTPSNREMNRRIDLVMELEAPSPLNAIVPQPER